MHHASWSNFQASGINNQVQRHLLLRQRNEVPNILQDSNAISDHNQKDLVHNKVYGIPPSLQNPSMGKLHFVVTEAIECNWDKLMRIHKGANAWMISRKGCFFLSKGSQSIYVMPSICVHVAPGAKADPGWLGTSAHGIPSSSLALPYCGHMW